MSNTDNQQGASEWKVDNELIKLLWGSCIRQDVFNSWAQGFTFSVDEPLALIQCSGGPCAVLVSVQAFMLKNLIFCEGTNERESWLSITEDHRKSLLTAAICDLLCQVVTENNYILVIDKLSCNGDLINLEQDEPKDTCDELLDQSCASTSTSLEGTSESCAKKLKLSDVTLDSFHQRIKCESCLSRQALLACVNDHIAHFTGPLGVLLLLYSVLLTKGKDTIKAEMEDLTESLINSNFGHGSQSLINLFIYGKAVNNVWDNDKDVSGMKLRGICKQSTIGFLTLHEHLRYCEVGWYLKNPEYPIWILGSESHLTVLFSQETRLVSNESPKQVAKRLFKALDTEGNDFIATSKLGTLMDQLKLETEPEYIKLMANQLDPDGFGIITLSDFLIEFYPGDPTEETVTKFTLFHHNGNPQSSNNGKVVFNEAEAILMDAPETQFITDNDTSDIQKCLVTKWPTLTLKWKTEKIPSIQ